MKARTKFMKFYYKLPTKARGELIFEYYKEPMSLNVCWLEIKNKTKRGQEILTKLGFEDEKETAEKITV